jgi:hypothetical protein
VTLNGAVTKALPPPVGAGAADAAGPITATVPACAAGSGRTPPSFFSSTVPSSATRAATAWWAGVVTVALVVPAGGWLKIPKRNISVAIRLTMVSTTDLGIVPFSTSVCSAGPKNMLNGCSMSVPSTAPWVLCRAA